MCIIAALVIVCLVSYLILTYLPKDKCKKITASEVVKDFFNMPLIFWNLNSNVLHCIIDKLKV